MGRVGLGGRSLDSPAAWEVGFIGRKTVVFLAVVVAAVTAFPFLPASAVTPAKLQERVIQARAALDRISARLNAAEGALDEAQSSADRHARAVVAAGSRLRTIGAAYGRRAAQLYVLGAGDMFRTLASSEDIDTFVERLGYLEQVRSGERGELEELTALRRRARVESARLAAARLRALAARDSYLSLRRQLDQKLHEYELLLNVARLASSRLPARASRGRIPGFRCPVAAPHALSNNYGEPRRGGPHTGVDIDAEYGAPVVAVLPAVVSALPTGGWIGKGIIIRDGSGTEWWYAHLSSRSVAVGERVVAGEFIGRVGCSGHCFGSHLHFEFHPGGGDPANPYRILRAAC